MAIFKENMEAVTPEEKHGLLHKTNILYGAWSTLPVFHHWYLGKRWSLAPFSCSLLGMMGVRSVHMPYMWKSCSWRLAQSFQEGLFWIVLQAETEEQIQYTLSCLFPVPALFWGCLICHTKLCSENLNKSQKYQMRLACRMRVACLFAELIVLKKNYTSAGR